MTRPSPASQRAIPVGMLLAAVALCGVALWFLIPNQRALLDRQLRDRAYDRSWITLQQTSPAERAKDPFFYDSAEILLRSQRLPKSTNPAWDQFLAFSLRTLSAHGERADLLRPIRDTLATSPNPTTLARLLHQYRPPLSTEARFLLARTLADRALAQNQPAAAAEILQPLADAHPQDASIALESARLWRLGGNPTNALAALAAIERTAPPLPPEHARLQIDLLRELNRVSLAFDAARNLRLRLGPQAEDSLLDLLITLARQSGRTAEVLDDARQRATALATNAVHWEELATLATEAADLATAADAWNRVIQTDPAHPRARLASAQALEWLNRPQDAFDRLLQTLKAGQLEALPILLRLNNGLYRDDELSTALQHLDPNSVPIETLLAVARLHARSARFDRALQLYPAAIARSPQPRPIEAELGQLHLDLANYPEAIHHLERALHGDTNDIPILAGIAEASFRSRNFPAALRHFRDLGVRHGDSVALDHYINLAESLGRTDEALLGVQARIDTATNATGRDFERLAYLAGLQGVTHTYRQSLAEGVRRFPNDLNLRLQAAYAFGDHGDFLDAARLLADFTGLHREVAAAAAYAGFLVQAHSFPEARAFLNRLDPALRASPQFLEVEAAVCEALQDPVGSRKAWKALHQLRPDDERVQLSYARALAETGLWKDARELIRPLLATRRPDILYLAAQVESAAGNHRQAEALLRRLIESRPSKPADAWRMLGDVLLARGNQRGARQAYARALDAFLNSRPDESSP